MLDEYSETINSYPVHRLTRRSFKCDVCGESTYFIDIETLKVYNIRTTFVNNVFDRWQRRVQCCSMKCVSDYIKMYAYDDDLEDISISKDGIERECYSVCKED